MAFVKGKSGNPGGRPRAVAEVQDLARAMTVQAMDCLKKIIDDKGAPAAARVAAVNAVLDRGWGKPTQAMEHSGPNGEPIPTSLAITFVKPDAGD